MISSGFLAAIALLGTSAAVRAEAPPILVGHYASMTGKEATFGQSTDRGIRLAIKEINAAGGLDGRKLELKTYDDKGESQEAGKAVTRLITDDKVVAVLGEVASGLSNAGGRVCQQYGIPMITPSSTNPNVTKIGDMVFRVCFTDDQQGYAMAKFAHDNLKKKRVAVLFDQSTPYSKGLKDYFVKFFKEMGGEIVSEQAYSGGDQDYSAQLTTIKAAKPELLVIPGYYTEGGNIAIQARKLGLGKDIPLLGADGWDSEQLGKLGGKDIEGAYYSNHSAPDQPGGNVTQFIEKYKAEYGGQTPDALTGLGYDACMVLFDAMKRCYASTNGLKGKDLAKAIAETKGYPGVTGTITIDKNRNAQKPIVMVQLKKGIPSWVANVEPKAE